MHDRRTGADLESIWSLGIVRSPLSSPHSIITGLTVGIVRWSIWTIISQYSVAGICTRLPSVNRFGLRCEGTPTSPLLSSHSLIVVNPRTKNYDRVSGIQPFFNYVKTGHSSLKCNRCRGHWIRTRQQRECMYYDHVAGLEWSYPVTWIAIHRSIDRSYDHHFHWSGL